MNWVEEVLLFIAKLNLLGNRGHLVGFLWIGILTVLFYDRLKPQKLSNSRFQRICWRCHALFTAFLCTWFLQLVMDEGVTMPLNLLSGSWQLLEDLGAGPFTFTKLLIFKWPAYLELVTIIGLFTAQKTWRHFRITRDTLFWLFLMVLFQSSLSCLHIWNRHMYDGWQLILVFFSATVLFRILTGCFGVNLIHGEARIN